VEFIGTACFNSAAAKKRMRNSTWFDSEVATKIRLKGACTFHSLAERRHCSDVVEKVVASGHYNPRTSDQLRPLIYYKQHLHIFLSSPNQKKLKATQPAKQHGFRPRQRL